MSSSRPPSQHPTAAIVQKGGEDQVADQRRTAIICAVVGSFVFVTVFVVIFALRKKEAWRRMKVLNAMNRQEVSLPLSRTNSRSGDSNDASAAHPPSPRLSLGGINVGPEQEAVPRKSVGNSTLNPMMTRQASSRASKKSPSIVNLIENHIPFQFCELHDAIPRRRDSNISADRDAINSTETDPENPKSSL